MDIVVWLRSLGLGKYEAVFRENDIEETIRGHPGSCYRIQSIHQFRTDGTTHINDSFRVADLRGSQRSR